MIGRRRVALGLGGFVWMAPTRALWADHRASPQEAGYVDHPGPGGIQCAACEFFQPGRGGPAHCQLVRGDILADGSCDFFARR